MVPEAETWQSAKQLNLVRHNMWPGIPAARGGRGFGFTGAHNHSSWQDDNFRKVMLNAILWTANVEIPENGCPSPQPSDEQIQDNLDK